MKFYKISKSLLESKDYRDISHGAKLLYVLILDRMSLSASNGWFDKSGKPFIYLSHSEAASKLGCSTKTIGRYFKELFSHGMIYYGKNQVGTSRPIYATNCPMEQDKMSGTHRTKCPTNYTEYNYTEYSNTESVSQDDDRLLLQILDNCELEIWQDGTDTLLQSVIETLYYTDSITVAGRHFNNEQIRKRLLALTGDALILVVDNMKRANVKNPYPYLKSAVINAADDYMAEVASCS